MIKKFDCTKMDVRHTRVGHTAVLLKMLKDLKVINFDIWGQAVVNKWRHKMVQLENIKK